MAVDQFKNDLGRLSANQMYERYILTGLCAAIADDCSFTIRSSIARQFSVDYTGVIIVGSANLGLSIKPTKRYVPSSDESDIDIAIVCSKLFERVWQEIYLFDKSGTYWPKKGAFQKYLSAGWIRPDKLPTSRVFQFSNQWWEYFRTLHEGLVPYKITGGIYYSQFFLQQYQMICIDQCKAEL